MTLPGLALDLPVPVIAAARAGSFGQLAGGYRAAFDACARALQPDADLLHLWAGTGFRYAADRPVADVLTDLAP